MARGYPKKKVVMYGVYHTFVVFGSPCRNLECVFPTKSEAEAKVNERLELYSWKKPDEYMIEEVEVTMKAWKI